MEKHRELGLSNQFTPRKGVGEINFRNVDETRTGLGTVEISGDTAAQLRTFYVRPEDNVAMAVAVLGVGRVDDHVEERAQRIVSLPGNHHMSDDDLIAEALTHLRALMVRRKRSVEEKQLTEDAYALYKLARPEDFASMEAFEKSMRDYWVGKLQSLRTL